MKLLVTLPEQVLILSSADYLSMIAGRNHFIGLERLLEEKNAGDSFLVFKPCRQC